MNPTEDGWHWFPTPIRAAYYWKRTEQQTEVRETYYLAVRYVERERRLIYLTEKGYLVGYSDVLGHKEILAV